MSDRMRPIPFAGLVRWVAEEYEREKSIFGISEKWFYRQNGRHRALFCGEELGIPLGPAAGPHTQMAQNLAAAYLTGGRFFELKTVQVLDRLEFPKPCINAADECYNTEWSTELSIEEAYAEYVKGWFLLHLLAGEHFVRESRSFVFNISVGYDLAGIRSAKVDRFIEGMKDAGGADIFGECRAVLLEESPRFRHFDRALIDGITPRICGSVALSTMHGCPPEETEAICQYLMHEKGLYTHVKLNPTLLGYDFVRDTLDRMGYAYIKLSRSSFDDDLRYEEAVPMLHRLIAYGKEHGKEFGIKLSNTLPVLITRGELPGEQMYLSGRPLYALTVNLAARLAAEFRGTLQISYSGGADRHNLCDIFKTGIEPVTVVTTLLKPGGYRRLNRLAAMIEAEPQRLHPGIDADLPAGLACRAIEEPVYHKKVKEARGFVESKAAEGGYEVEAVDGVGDIEGVESENSAETVDGSEVADGSESVDGAGIVNRADGLDGAKVGEVTGVVSDAEAIEGSASVDGARGVTARLFDCRARCGNCIDVCPNRANVAVHIESPLYRYERQILHLDGLCNQCGNCATFCPEGIIPYREKPTLFPGAEDFADSANTGFVVFAGEQGKECVKVRVSGEVIFLSGDEILKETADSAAYEAYGEADQLAGHALDRETGRCVQQVMDHADEYANEHEVDPAVRSAAERETDRDAHHAADQAAEDVTDHAANYEAGRVADRQAADGAGKEADHAAEPPRGRATYAQLLCLLNGVKERYDYLL